MHRLYLHMHQYICDNLNSRYRQHTGTGKWGARVRRSWSEKPVACGES